MRENAEQLQRERPRPPGAHTRPRGCRGVCTSAGSSAALPELAVRTTRRGAGTPPDPPGPMQGLGKSLDSF
eukprot:1187209-Prorocentrum_minimum.AAC.4